MRDIRVAAVQFQHAPGDKAYNLGRVRHFVADAARQGVEIIAFPEMCLTGYWHVRKLSREAFEALAEPVPNGPCTEELLRLSREHGVTVGAGLIERADDGRFYNAYVVAMPDGTFAVHRKLHVFVSPFLSEGDRYTVFETPHGCRVGVLDLLRQQHRRKRACHRAARRRDSARSASDGRVQLGQSARDEAGGSRDLGASTRGSSRDSCGTLRDQGACVAHALASEPRARQRDVPGVQQRHRARRRRDPHRERDGARPVWRGDCRDVRAGRRHGRRASRCVAAADVVGAALAARAPPGALREPNATPRGRSSRRGAFDSESKSTLAELRRGVGSVGADPLRQCLDQVIDRGSGQARCTPS